MNKKFSTLLASLLVASGMTSVSAAADNGVKKVEDLTYQLENADASKLLVMDKNTDGSYTASLTENADYSASLWNVKVIKNEGVAPKFKLVNKLTGCPLSVDLKTLKKEAQEVNMGGNISEWNWLDATESNTAFGEKVLYSYFTADSVVYLTGDNGKLQAAKGVMSDAAGATFKIKPVVVAAHTLTAKELNTKLGADPVGESFKLTATPELKKGVNSALGNVFTSTTFRAWNGNSDLNVWQNEKENFELYALTQSTLESIKSENGYVLLQVIDGENDDNYYEDHYQMVDTSYLEGTTNNLKLISFDKAKVVTEPWGNGKYVSGAAGKGNINAYMFKFVYHATNDSLAIYVKEYKDKATEPKAKDGSYWVDGQVSENTLLATTKLTSTTELTVLTADKNGLAPEGNIKFMLDTKAATSNFTSVANNVYTIKNNKGQYLAVPIYNSNKATSYAAAEWVTVSEQEVNHMPAYQWVVVKENTGADFEKTAPVKMTNREFVAVNDANVQLRQGGEFMYVVGSNLDSVSFNAVPEEYIKDKYLGYMNLDENDLKVMTYNFNYFNPYVSDKYIGFDGDSLLTVKNGKDAFYLVKNAADKYGYVSDGSEGIKGLVKQLVRFSYSPYMKNAKGVQYVGLDEEDQYYVAPSAKTAKNFFFKENNFYQPEGAEAARPYYAFVDLTAAQAATKAGTSDQTMSAVLKNQVMEETRTSAFAVTTNDVPLYRRFNSVTLDGAVAGNEDAVKLLKFKETYRGNEYLMDEANETFKNEGVNYLGIWTADKKAAGLSFNVDTAVLSLSTAGKIKPQYFIYVSKEVVEAIPGVPCDATDHKHMDVNGKPCDADHCIHATPAKAGYTVAKYLVSFADSLNATDANKLYQYGKYTRVGFVKALKMDEKLYFLKNGLQNVAAKDLDLDDVKKYSDVVDLKALSKDDNHHNYTWSFRYVDPEAAANEVEEDRAFLFESNNYDGVQVAPSNAAWLKIQNGCLVLTDNASTFENAKLGEDNALIFNIEKGSADDMATENETITTSNVVIAATEGAVVVKGAEGKTVTVATILGKVVANQVLSSDNATIAAPAGVVVVSVDGESFKVVVK